MSLYGEEQRVATMSLSHVTKWAQGIEESEGEMLLEEYLSLGYGRRLLHYILNIYSTEEDMPNLRDLLSSLRDLFLLDPTKERLSALLQNTDGFEIIQGCYQMGDEQVSRLSDQLLAMARTREAF